MRKILLFSLLLAACAPVEQAEYSPAKIMAEGKLDHIKQNGFVLKTKTGYAFFSYDDAEALKSWGLKQGEHITILGSPKPGVEITEDTKDEDIEYVPSEIMRKSGRHIRLD